MKRIISVILILTIALTMASCGNSNNNTNNNPPATTTDTQQATSDSSQTAAETTQAVVPAAETRTIKIGTWWDIYYTSANQSIYDNPRVVDEFRAQMALDNVREIEERYNVKIEAINLTWEGTIESINTSIMAGTPDCDMYFTDLQFGIPAVLNGYAQALEDFLPADSDVLQDQVIMKHLNLLDDPKNYLFSEVVLDAAGYPLGFNMDMIQDANLEDPRDVYDRGEWTWDVWREYLQALTKDTNGDGVTDVYGYGGYWTNMLEKLLLSNNTHIAGDKTEGISSPGTIEVFEFFNTIYNVDKTARPWVLEDWESNLKPFTDGMMAFFVTKDWIIQGMGDSGAGIPFELGVVPWPYGPRGSKESSQKAPVSGNWCIIPVGVEDPELVYNVYYDYVNWFKDDLSIRDEGGTADWQRDMYMTERNFEMAMENGKIGAFDIWGSLGLGDSMTMVSIMNGEKTPAQYAEETKLLVQDRLNAYFGN